MFVQIQIEMSENNAYKQYPSDTQRNARHFHLSQYNAESDDKRQNKNGMCHSASPKIGITFKKIP